MTTERIAGGLYSEKYILIFTIIILTVCLFMYYQWSNLTPEEKQELEEIYDNTNFDIPLVNMIAITVVIGVVILIVSILSYWNYQP